MNLTKKKLITMVQPMFDRLGFVRFSATISKNSSLFVKKVDEGLFLTIGMNIHRFYDSMFTCDMYLSRTTNFACLWGDMPRSSYSRPGRFLTKAELECYSQDGDNVADIWWDAGEAASVQSFSKVLQIAVERMSNDKQIIHDLFLSHDVEVLYEFSHSVKDICTSKKLIPDGSFHKIPSKELDGIPMCWFCAAELALTNTSFFNERWVKYIAADAYRQFMLDNTKQSASVDN